MRSEHAAVGETRPVCDICEKKMPPWLALIFGTSLKVVEENKTFLYQCFEMKNLVEADVILNIKLLRDENNGITLV